MDKHNSSELLNSDFSLSKNASSDSLDSDSKSSSLNSKHGQDSVSFLNEFNLFLSNMMTVALFPVGLVIGLVVIVCCYLQSTSFTVQYNILNLLQ